MSEIFYYNDEIDERKLFTSVEDFINQLKNNPDDVMNLLLMKEIKIFYTLGKIYEQQPDIGKDEYGRLIEQINPNHPVIAYLEGYGSGFENNIIRDPDDSRWTNIIKYAHPFFWLTDPDAMHDDDGNNQVQGQFVRVHEKVIRRTFKRGYFLPVIQIQFEQNDIIVEHNGKWVVKDGNRVFIYEPKVTNNSEIFIVKDVEIHLDEIPTGLQPDKNTCKTVNSLGEEVGKLRRTQSEKASFKFMIGEGQDVQKIQGQYIRSSISFKVKMRDVKNYINNIDEYKIPQFPNES